MILLALVVLTAIVAQTRFSDKGVWFKPSLLTSVAFAIASLIAVRVQDTLAVLLGFLLAGVLLLALYDKRKRSFGSLILGALLGSFITILAFYLFSI